MSSFDNLKRNSGNNFDKLNKLAQNANSSYTNDDDGKYWKCELDKAGNGYAVIRFLPSPSVDGDDGDPFVKYYDHGFQGPGGWYIEKSLTSIGEKDPMSEHNSQLWTSGIESNKELARKQKRRLHFVSNVYVIKDSKNPENEGKVFLFKYGKKIFEKLTQAMNPQFEDDVKIDPFDFWAGANFKLKIRKVDGYQNYDLSEFDSPNPLFEDDKEMENVWKQEYSLKEIVDPSNFKSYDELKKRLDKVLGTSTQETTQKLSTVQQMKMSAPPVAKVDEEVSVEEDDDLEYFKNLINDED